MNGPHQVGFLERFGQEVDRAGLDRAYRRGNIAVSRDEHNLREGSLSRLAEQVEAVDVRKLDVQNETRRYVWFRICEVLRSGTKRDHMQIEGRQQVGQRFADLPVVIHDEHDMVLRAHSREDAPLPARSPSDQSRVLRVSQSTRRGFTVYRQLLTPAWPAASRFVHRTRRVASMDVITPSVMEDQPFVLSNLPPSPGQKRLALGIVLGLIVALYLVIGPFGGVQLGAIHSFVAVYTTGMFVTDSITAILLYAQFSILRSRAILVIASGYLFTALLIVPYVLAFPGVLAPDGVVGGLQTTAHLYLLWHCGFPLFVIGYALSKDEDPSRRYAPARGSVCDRLECRLDSGGRDGAGISVHPRQRSCCRASCSISTGSSRSGLMSSVRRSWRCARSRSSCSGFGDGRFSICS